MAILNIKVDNKSLQPQKAIVGPIFGSKNVLTNSRWEFVELWLKKEKKYDALFFWNQSREFSRAAAGLSMASSPLLHYYSFMNAAKALLSSKNIAFSPYHGVGQYSAPNRRVITLSNEGVAIRVNGVLPSLSIYYGEAETSIRHTLQEIFYNLPYIHRTYCLSYKGQKDMFIPIKNTEFVKDTSTNEVYFRAIISDSFSSNLILRRLPPSLRLDYLSDNIYGVRSVDHITIRRPTNMTDREKRDLNNLHLSLRKDILYINGTHTLWYIKGNVPGPAKIERFPTTLTLAAMHRLSELSRYKPTELNSFFESQKNWLISEFIQQSPDQFLDEMASEITGYQFLQPNIRFAT